MPAPSTASANNWSWGSSRPFRRSLPGSSELPSPETSTSTPGTPEASYPRRASCSRLIKPRRLRRNTNIKHDLSSPPRQHLGATVEHVRPKTFPSTHTHQHRTLTGDHNLTFPSCTVSQSQRAHSERKTNIYDSTLTQLIPPNKYVNSHVQNKETHNKH